MNNLKFSILFLTFNRLDTTKRVFEEIKKAKPLKLYIASDGPREDVLGEDEKVKEVRNFIESNIDWECEVKTLYRDKNLGCGKAVSDSITWFFENEEEGIILEDDCLPNQDFFKFCCEMLSFYRKNESVFMIAGSNIYPKKMLSSSSSYDFIKIPRIWGWASWRRAWRYYDFNLEGFGSPSFCKVINATWHKKEFKKYWYQILKDVYYKKLDTWDYQWAYSMWRYNGLCLLSKFNLVSNIGFGTGVHTWNKKNKISNLKNENFIFPIKKSSQIKINEDLDDYDMRKNRVKLMRIKNFLKAIGLFEKVKLVYSKF